MLIKVGVIHKIEWQPSIHLLQEETKLPTLKTAALTFSNLINGFGDSKNAQL